LVAEGRTSREIAASLVVSPHTVRKHIEHILEKLEVPTRSAAVPRAFGPASAVDERLARSRKFAASSVV
jgi:DNA-binding NarL/FixJ family response regulator